MSNIQCKSEILRIKKTVVTRASFWKIPHNHLEKEDIRLKLGRYKKTNDFFHGEELETSNPKSELTLDNEEFTALIKFLQDNYEPFNQVHPSLNQTYHFQQCPFLQ